METGRQTGQELGGAELAGGGADWLAPSRREGPPPAGLWQGDVPSGGAGRAARPSARLKRPAGARFRRQFAEAFYLMVMASDLRERARALGRRYGMDAMEVREEILRYMDDLCSSAAGAGP